MTNSRFFTISRYFYGLFIMCATLGISHSMEITEEFYEGSTPMVPHQRENFWEIQNLELIFRLPGEIAGSVIMIPGEMGSGGNFYPDVYLMKMSDGLEKIKDKDYENILDHVFDLVCQQFEMQDAGIKKILSNIITLEKIKATALLQKNADNPQYFPSIAQGYAQDLIKIFYKHRHYAIGQQNTEHSQLFQFKDHPLHVSKTNFSWGESLNIYIPRANGEDTYYDDYFFLSNKNPIKNIQQLLADKGVRSSTLCLKIANVHMKSKLSPEFIFDHIR